MGIDVVTELRAQEACQRGPRGNATYLSDLNKRAADEIDRLRYVLGGVRGAIETGRNEPLVIWKEQIDIALDSKPNEASA